MLVALGSLAGRAFRCLDRSTGEFNGSGTFSLRRHVHVLGARYPALLRVLMRDLKRKKQKSLLSFFLHANTHPP